MLRKSAYFILIGSLFTISCNTNIQQTNSNSDPVLIKVNLLADSTQSTFNEYDLATTNPDADSIESRKIIDLKMELLNAIERKDSLFLNDILNDTFSFVSNRTFFGKVDFINQRINEGIDLKKIKIIDPTLHILNGTAILSFAEQNLNTDNLEITYWTEVYKQKDQKWHLYAVQKR
ncbi:nuclear transport factor 2 family protein [Pedobacter flavus]|uniref:Nuclear transport factor 2 family protein n=1 Tax=Pedobacter flavus TaxID=3113906 RepID=A0ABU7H2A5_9SPHI|nr:nuclear transport factor 2 family protein [Pedobacter sp. VNH31]MEE1885429.1 nuclear transport factor 2 family protein [Pedobacter sp. VNH31]